jgi:hypothetical protein
MTDTPRRANYSAKLERQRQWAQDEEAKVEAAQSSFTVSCAPRKPTPPTTVRFATGDGGLAKDLSDTRSAVARQLERERGRAVGDPMNEDQARALTDRIKRDVEAVWALIREAYLGRAWTALGYESWDAYCVGELGTARLRIPREERPEMVTSLREAGLSIRAIASATGIDKNTVQADLAQASEIHTPDAPVDEDALAEELIAADANPIIGTDGKSYPPKWPPALRPGLVDDDDEEYEEEGDFITGRFADWGDVYGYVDDVKAIGLRRDDVGELAYEDPDLATSLTADDLPTDDLPARGSETWFYKPREYADELRAALPRIQELIDLLEEA